MAPRAFRDWAIAGGMVLAIVAIVVAFGAALLPHAVSGARTATLTPKAGPTASPTPDVAAIPGQFSEKDLDDMWTLIGDPSQPRPHVSVVAIVSPDQWRSVIVACMNAAGYPGAHLVGDNSFTFGDPPPGREAEFAVADFTCEASYPIVG